METGVLVDREYNPIPEDAVAGFVTTPDAMKIRYARWKSKAYPVKGTVLLLHGRSEFIEKLFETVTALRNSGFDVLTFDWRGQGGSSRMLEDRARGYVDSFDQYTMDPGALHGRAGIAVFRTAIHQSYKAHGALRAVFWFRPGCHVAIGIEYPQRHHVCHGSG